MCTECRCLQKPQVLDSSGAGVSDGYKLLNTGAENATWVFCESNKHWTLSHWDTPETPFKAQPAPGISSTFQCRQEMLSMHMTIDQRMMTIRVNSEKAESRILVFLEL